MHSNENERKRISVIIPLFNAEKFLSQTLSSICFQLDSKTDEVLVIDDWSSDQSLRIVEEFQKKFPFIRLFRTTENSGGPAKPRNIGIKEARGIYIAFCDADDIWHHKKISLQLPLLNFYDVVCTEMIHFKNSPPKVSMNFDITIKEKKIKSSDFYFGNPVANSSVICKAKSIQQFSFNESSAYIAVEDFDLWIRMCSKKFLFVKLVCPLLLYRRSPKQISVNKFKMVKKNFILYTNIFGRLRAFLFTVLYIISSFFRIIKRSI